MLRQEAPEGLLGVRRRGTGYFHTLFAPSTALLPLEYCLNLIDQEMIGDDGLEDLTKWRAFIKAESGVELTIEA